MPNESELTSEEWEAVRRLRARSAAAPPAEPPAAPRAADPSPVPAAPVAAEPPAPEPAAAEPVASTPAVADPAAEPADDELAPEPPLAGGRPASGRGLPALILLAVLAVVAVVLAALPAFKLSDRHARDRASTQAVAAAASGVSTVLSYNYKSLDTDFTKAEALLTPSFRKTYQATTAKAVQPLAAKYKAVSTAQVTAAGVISAAPSKATVLVFVSQQVTNTQLSAPRLDRSRIVVDLVHQKGHWLIAKLSPV